MLIAAFLTGLLGSLHCLGMCGPLALSLPAIPYKGVQGRSSSTKQFNYVFGRILYNAGRLTSYAFLGGLVSLLGVAASLFDLQRYVSLVMGALLIALAIKGFIQHKRKSQASNFLFRWVSATMGRFFASPHPSNLFTIGLLNGMLPCGLVYIGLFQAALATSPWEGMAVMAVFGLGTWPMMLGVSLSGPWLRRNLMGRVRSVLPALMLVTGLMLSLRGMALGIPYLSPKMELNEGGAAEITCCTPLQVSDDGGEMGHSDRK